MGGLLDAVRSITGGVAQAAGNQSAHDDLQAQVQRDRQAKQQQLQLQIAPLSEALRADQTRLALYANPDDPTKPLAGKEAEYKQTLDRMTSTIGQMRGLYGGKPQGANPVEAGVGNLLDSLHITNHLKNHVAQVRAENAKKYAGQTSSMATSYAGAVPPNPLIVKQVQAQQAGASPAEIEAMKNPLTRPQDKTDQDKFVNDYLQRNPSKTREDAVRAWTDATTKDTSASKPDAPLEAGGVPYGVRVGGAEYPASTLGPNGTAPPQAKEMWKTIKDAQAQKRADEQKKEDETNERFLRSQQDIAARMGQSENFQAQMAGYREQLSNYKTQDANADNTQTLADTYEAQYKQPGNHSATDTALLTDYTSVLAKGGRKTQAEIQLARNIGSFELNLEQKLKKATTGELPDELRKMYLDYINAAAKTQREDADKLKPEPPTIGVPEGPKTKALRATARGGWTPPAGAPAAPKQDGKLLKADGKVIAKSRGGNWVEP
jgi:hypothetical protein